MNKPIEQIRNFFNDLDIELEEVSPELALGDDIGMDSQEIVELVLLVEKHYGIKVPPRSLTKSSTLGDVVGLIERLGPAAAPPPYARGGFDQGCEARMIIDFKMSEVYRALHQLENWTKYLPHIVGLDVLYDDGRYQEFKMRVASKNGILEVRSIRDCDGVSRIQYFQPGPPPFLKHHAGGWQLVELGPNRTEVIATHKWRLKPQPDGAAALSPGEVETLMLDHARTSISHWKRVLEAGQLSAS